MSLNSAKMNSLKDKHNTQQEAAEAKALAEAKAAKEKVVKQLPK